MSFQQGTSLSVGQHSHQMLISRDSDRCSDYTGRSGTRAPCRGKHRTSTRTVCTLYACEPVTSVDGVAVVWRDYELAPSRTNWQRYLEFTAFYDIVTVLNASSSQWAFVEAQQGIVVLIWLSVIQCECKETWEIGNDNIDWLWLLCIQVSDDCHMNLNEHFI